MIADWFAIYLAAKGFDLARDRGRLLGAVPRRRPRQLLRRRPLERAHQARVVGGPRAARGDRGRRHRRAGPHSRRLLVVVPAPRRLLRGRDVLLRGAVHERDRASRPTSTRAARWRTVAGMAGTGAGLGTIGSTYLIGVVADRFSFTPILVVSSVVPLLAALLVRRPRAQHQGLGPGAREGDLMARAKPRVVGALGPGALRLVLRRRGRSGGCRGRSAGRGARPRHGDPALRALLAEADALVTTWDSPRFGDDLDGPRPAAAARRALRRGGEGQVRAVPLLAARDHERARDPWRPTSRSWP